MKLKSKLIISFCIIIFVPVLLTCGVIIGFKNIQIREIEENYGLEKYDYLTSSIQMLSQCSKGVYSSIKAEIEKTPDKYVDKAYLQEKNSSLSAKKSYIMVRLENEIIYCGSDKDDNALRDKLPAYGEEKANTDSGVYIDGDIQSFIRQIDFVLGDNRHGSVFIVTSVRDIIPEVKNIAIQAILAMILILISTAVMLIIWVYTSIITPIKKLQIAAKNIENGNLDFTIEVDTKDEIGELCQNFESMRLRLKQSSEEKLESERENKILISNISHDLKTPITAIKGYVEGIMDGVAATPEKQEKYLKTIYNKANEMNLLINELTLYSQIDTNRIPYNFKKINLNAYFSDCVEELEMELDSKDIGLAYFNYTDSDIMIIADPEQLKRVVNNIIGNSIKYMDKRKGFINIRIKDVGDFVQIEIEDNGKGIASCDLPHVFDRFYRADESRNSATGGSGIGLSIVRKIIEDHSGKIWATSKVETGTIICFVLRKYQEVQSNEQSADN